MTPRTPTKLICLLAISLAVACGGGTATPSPAPTGADAGERGGGQARGADAAGDADETTYADVIEDAESDDGLFTVHHKDDDYLFEIPDSLLGRDMLLVSRISGKMDGLGGFAPAGVATNRQMVRFERRGDRVLLRKYSGRGRRRRYAGHRGIGRGQLLRSHPRVVGHRGPRRRLDELRH